MLKIPGHKIVEQLITEGNYSVYRALKLDDNSSVILKVISIDGSTSNDVALFQQEYKIMEHLNGVAGIPKVYSLKKVDTLQVLTIEDVGTESLQNSLIKSPSPDLNKSLAIAINIVDILIEIHEHNIIHKDLNPTNIIVSPEDGSIKIIDFGISTKLSKQHQSIRPPEALEGTLQYISPEQTGRMNCTLDYRSDFYSLGIILYELITGVLPFTTSDPMELVHCHIAKRPIPPIDINSAIPQIISDLVLKLLKKSAEERYQSGWGIKYDLQQCKNALQNPHLLESFILAQYDLSDQFRISQKLYGRQHEIDTLISAFNSVSIGKMEIMLVSGYSGVGKSALVKSIHNDIINGHGYFITGKIDQLQGHLPYSSIVSAFGELVQQLLTEPDEQLNHWRTIISETLKSNGQVIIDLIPEIELIIGPQPPVPLLGPTESKNRFNITFLKIIHLFCTPSHPLVLFLDDLQWVDSATLELLELIAKDKEPLALLLIGAYRSNEVSQDHLLTLSIDNLKKTDIQIKQISLSPLTYNNINQLIAESLHQEMIATKSLTDLVMEKTNGNPFFVNQFLQTLYSESLLYFIPYKQNMDGYWKWDIKQIDRLDITENVVDLMTFKLKKLPNNLQNTIHLAACIGNRFDLDTLSIIHDESETSIQEQLSIIMSEGLILPDQVFRMEEAGKEGKLGKENIKLLQNTLHHFCFTHDRIQQAAYSLISPEERKNTHLMIARLMHLSKEIIMKERVFEITNHFNTAITEITDSKEKKDLANYNLLAGNKAISSMAGEAALDYFNTGISLLPKKCWQEHYDLAFELSCGAIKSAYFTASYSEAEKLCHDLLKKARSTFDKVEVYSLLCNIFTLQNEMEKTISTGLEALKLLNIDLLEKQPEIENTTELRYLKEMTDPNVIAAMSILVDIVACSLVTQSPYMLSLIYTMVDLSVNYGNCSRSPFGYVWYGCTLCWSRTDIKLGYQFGRLAIDVMEQFEQCEVKTTVLHQFNSFIRHWCEPEINCLNDFPGIVQISKENGEIEYGTYAAVNYVANLLLAGEPLPSTQEKQRPYLEWIASTKFSFSLTYGDVFAQTVQCLMEKCRCSHILEGDFMDEKELIHEMERTNNKLNLFVLYACKSMLFYLNTKYEECLSFAIKSEEYEEAIGGLLPVTQPPFYGALALLKIESINKAWDPDKDDRLTSYLNKLNFWSNYCESNFQHKYDLIAAEKARISGKKWDAAKLYEKAINGAKKNSYLHEEAIAYELAAEFYFEQNMEELANTHLKSAYYRYKQWGGVVKMKQLEKKYGEVLSFQQNKITSIHGNLDQLDLNSILKASLTLSKEIALNQLLIKMMAIAIENSGAEKGFLLLPDQNKWFIEAQWDVSKSNDVILDSIPLKKSRQVPESVIYYVLRTGKSVILQNAIQDNSFSHDSYIKKYRPKSILCVPLLSQKKNNGNIIFRK